MTRWEFARLAVLATVMGIVYAGAALVLLRVLVRRLHRGESAADTRGAILLQRGFVAAAALGTLCIAYGFLVEPHWLDVSTTRVPCRALPAGTAPIRVVHLSDLHCEPYPQLEEEVVAAVRRVRPDLVLFTGDALNLPESLPVFRKMLTEVAAIAPTYAVRGNYDVWYWRDLVLFGDTGAVDLALGPVEVEIRGTRVRLTGAHYDDEEAAGKAMAAARPGVLDLFLYHTPDLADRVAETDVDLYACGHTHGGQVAMPLYGALVTLTKTGKRFEAGLYDLGGPHLHTSRGIGMEGGEAPRVRFWSRPQVAILELVPVED